jgi:tetratricopeptide (TPR) repeat protein
MNSRRAGLKLILLALAVALLGLVPYPQAFTTAMRQGEVYRLAHEHGAALDAYQRAAHLDLESPLPWLQTGEILLRQHRFVQATVAFREAERMGGREMAWLGLGESLAGRGDWAAALQAWVHARAMVPGDARVYVALGRGKIVQSQFDQAIRHLAQALNCRPAAGEAAASRALLGRLLVADDPVRAADHFRRAGDEDMLAVLSAAWAEPDPARRDLFLGSAFLQRGELTLARRQFERAAALEPFEAEPHAYLAHTLDRLGETAAARELLDRALALDPDSALAYYFLGVHHRQIGNVEDAQAALWEALLRDPDNAALYVEMAEAFVDLGDYPRAEEWYRGAVEVAPEDLEFHLILAHFYLNHLYRVEEGGLPAAQAAVALGPGDPRPYDLLGWGHYLAGKPLEGERFLLQALILEPDLASAHYHLGSLYTQSGQRVLARQHLQRAADLDTEGYYRAHAEALLSAAK